MNALAEARRAPLRFQVAWIVAVLLIAAALFGAYTDKRQDNTDVATLARLEALVKQVDADASASDQEGCAFGNVTRAILREVLLTLADELLEGDNLTRIKDLIYKATTERLCDEIPGADPP